MFVADGGCKDKHGWSMTPNGHNTREQCMKAKVRARHECVNGYFKVFEAFDQKWRHHRSKHGTAFMAAANIVQARIQLEPTVFQCQCKDCLKKELRKLGLKHEHCKQDWQ